MKEVLNSIKLLIKKHTAAIVLIVSVVLLTVFLISAISMKYDINAFNNSFSRLSDHDKLERLLDLNNKAEIKESNLFYLNNATISRKENIGYSAKLNINLLLNRVFVGNNEGNYKVYNEDDLFDSKVSPQEIKLADKEGIVGKIDFAKSAYRANSIIIRRGSKNYIKDLSNADKVETLDTTDKQTYYSFYTPQSEEIYLELKENKLGDSIKYFLHQISENVTDSFSISKSDYKYNFPFTYLFGTRTHYFITYKDDVVNNIYCTNFNTVDNRFEKIRLNLLNKNLKVLYKKYPYNILDERRGSYLADIILYNDKEYYKVRKSKIIDTLSIQSFDTKEELTEYKSFYNLKDNILVIHNEDRGFSNNLKNGITVFEKYKQAHKTSKIRDSFFIKSQITYDKDDIGIIAEDVLMVLKNNKFESFAKDFNNKTLSISPKDSILLGKLKQSNTIINNNELSSFFLVQVGVSGNFLFAIRPINNNGKLTLEIRNLTSDEKFGKDEITVSSHWDVITTLIILVVYIILCVLSYIQLKNYTETNIDTVSYSSNVKGFESLNYKTKFVKSTLSDLKRRSNIMLIIGIGLGLLGAVVSSLLFTSSSVSILDDWKKPITLITVIKPIAMVLFVETFAFYFLKQYRIIFNEYKLFYSVYLRLLSYYNYADVSNMKDMNGESRKAMQSKVIDEKFDLYETGTKSSINEFENYLSMDKFIDIIKDKVTK